MVDTSIIKSNSSQEPKTPWKYTTLGTYSLVLLHKISCENEMNSQLDLLSSINYLKLFKEIYPCIQHIKSVSEQHRIIIVVTDGFIEQLLPEIHSLRQVFSVYICSNDNQRYQNWHETYGKIKGVDCTLTDIIKKLRSDRSRRARRRNEEFVSISVFDSKCCSEKSTTGIDGQFVHTQLLMSCLLQMKASANDKDEFISTCRKLYQNKTKQLKLVDEFALEYEPEYSLWWYTRESFLYHILNKALRVQNIRLLFLLRFYIQDVENDLRQRQHLLPIQVYRGQLMSIEELNLLKNSNGNLILMNSFLSTTLDLKTALFYLGDSSNDQTLQRVLFEIKADPRLDNTKPFADLSKVSLFSEEQEILMMVGSIFCLNNIHKDENNIWHIQMTLCCDKDCPLQNIFYHMRDQYDSNDTRFTLLANVLIDMANFDDAEIYLRQLLKKISPDDKDIYKCYHALGKVLFEKGQYDDSLLNMTYSLECLQKQTTNQIGMAYVYNGLGEVCQSKGDLKRALEFYEGALRIFKKTFNDEDENIAWCYNNLGTVYIEQNDYSRALKILTKALAIKQKLLPDSHPCLGNTYNNLGNVNFYLRDYEQALQNYQLSYNIFKSSVTPRHPSLARVLRNIGITYEAKLDFIQAQKNYEETLHIREQILSKCHPDLIEIRQDLQRVSLKLQQSCIDSQK